MPEEASLQEINFTVQENAEIKAANVGNDNQAMTDVQAGGHVVQAQNSDVTIVGGDNYAIQVYSLGVSEQGKGDWAAYRKQLRKENEQPYKFLRYYETTDADLFFGRDAICDHIIEKLLSYKSVLINGKSGSGKSSLVNAGLIPRLMNKGYLTFVFRDYGYPTDLLKQALHGIQEFQLDVADCLDLTAILSRMMSSVNRPITVFLDQFERFFENLLKPERLRFIQEMKTCFSAFSGKELALVFSIREDFYGCIGEFWDAFPEFDSDSYKIYLKLLSRTEAREAIIKPLKGLPIRYEKGFVDDVLLPGLIGQTSSDEQIEPPHLQIVCNQLYDEARQRYAADLADGELVQIGTDLYHAIGSTHGILHHYLDGVVARLAGEDPEKMAVVRSMLKLMIHTSGTRKFVSLHDLAICLPDVPEADLQKFTGYLREARVVEMQGQYDVAKYSLSHEFMVEKVQSWYDEREIERKKAIETLERGLAEFRSNQTLLGEQQVRLIRQWLPADTLPEDAQLLLNDSQAAYEREAWEKAERDRRLRDEENARRRAEKEYADEQKKRAEEAEQSLNIQKQLVKQAEAEKTRAEIQKKKALQTQSLFLVDLARQQNESENYGDAILLALEALPENMNQPERLYVSKAEVQLYQAVTHLLERLLLKGHRGSVLSSAFNPDGTRIVTASEDTTVLIWDVATHGILARLKGHEKSVNSAVFSPDGTRIITAAEDNTAQIWDALTGAALVPLIGHKGPVNSAVFSPDGTRIVTAASDNTARIWDASDGRTLLELNGHTNAVNSAAFNSDGKLVITASADETARLWDADTGEELATIVWNEGNVYSAAFSPNSSLIAIALSDTTVRLWQTASGQEVMRLIGHTGDVHSAIFSPNGRCIASASADGTARLWDIKTGKKLATLVGHAGELFSAGFDYDGRHVVTASADRTARVWDISQILYAVTDQTIATQLGYENNADSGIHISRRGHIDTTLRRDIGELLIDIPKLQSEKGRRAIMIEAGLEKIILDFEIHGNPKESIMRIIDQLDRHGALADGQPALVAFLETFSSYVGINKREIVESLCKRIFAISQDTTGRIYTKLHRDIGYLLLSLPNIMDNRNWRTLIFDADLDHTLYENIDFDGTPNDVVKDIIEQCHKYGTMTDGRLALVALLQAAAERVGGDRRAHIHNLIERIVTASGNATVPFLHIASLKTHDGDINSTAFPQERRIDTIQPEIEALLFSLSELQDQVSRQAFINSAGLDAILPNLELRGSLRKFVTRMLIQLEQYGTLDDGRPAIIALLEIAENDSIYRQMRIRHFYERLLSSSEEAIGLHKDVNLLWELRIEVEELLLSLPALQNQVERQAFIDGAGLNAILPNVELRGSTKRFITRLFKQLQTCNVLNNEGLVFVPLLQTAECIDKGWQKRIHSLCERIIATSQNDDIQPGVTRKVFTSHAIQVSESSVSASVSPILLAGHECSVSFAKFSLDGTQVVTVSDDNTARIWEVSTGTILSVLAGHKYDVVDAMFSPDGTRLVTASWDNTARVWDTITGKKLSTLFGHTAPVVSATFILNGTRVVTASWDNTARVWDAVTGQEVRMLAGHTDRVVSVAISPNETTIVTASWDNTARIWDTITGQEVAMLAGHTDRVISTAFSPDGNFVATASADNTVRIWETDTGKETTRLIGHNMAVESAVFSPDGKRILTASWDGTYRLWDVINGQELAILNGRNKRILKSAMFNSDNTPIDKILILRREIRQLLLTLPNVYNRDGLQAFIASASLDISLQNQLTLEGSPKHIFTEMIDRLDRYGLMTDGRFALKALLETASQRVGIDRQQVIRRLCERLDHLTSLRRSTSSYHWFLMPSAAFSPDGTRIVTASDKSTAQIWDTVSGAELAMLTGHTDEVNSVAFSPDGKHVVTASMDKTARIWHIFRDTQELLDYANSIIPRRLTLEDRKKYFLE